MFYKISCQHSCTRPWYQLCGKLSRTSAVSPPVSWQLLPVLSHSTSPEPRDLCQCRLECQTHLYQSHNKRASKNIIRDTANTSSKMSFFVGPKSRIMSQFSQKFPFSSKFHPTLWISFFVQNAKLRVFVRFSSKTNWSCPWICSIFQCSSFYWAVHLHTLC